MNLIDNSPRDTLFGGNNADVAVKISVGLGIVSRKESITLYKSLESHRASGLLDLFDRVCILHQDAEREYAVRVDHPYTMQISEAKNTGVMCGMVAVAKRLSTDYVLFLGPDTHSIEGKEVMREELREAVEKMETTTGSARDKTLCYLANKETLKFVRMQHTPDMKELNRDCFPHTQTHGRDGKHWYAPTPIMPWSNIGAFVPREWFLKTFIPAVMGEEKKHQVLSGNHIDIEKTLEKGVWWRQQPWRVGMLGTELFQWHRHQKDDKALLDNDVYQQFQPFYERQWVPPLF